MNAELTPIYVFGIDAPVLDFEAAPYVIEEDVQTVRPTVRNLQLADIFLTAKSDDDVPDFNSAIVELGEPERGSEYYETLARLYQYGYDADGNVQIWHERWSINEQSTKAMEILLEIASRSA